MSPNWLATERSTKANSPIWAILSPTASAVLIGYRNIQTTKLICRQAVPQRTVRDLNSELQFGDHKFAVAKVRIVIPSMAL